MTGGEPTMGPRAIVCLALAGIGFGFAVLWMRSLRGRSKDREASDIPKIPEPGPEQLKFVRDQVSEHREQYLTYLARMQGIREGLPSSEIDRLLVGRKPILGSPTLLLESENFIWRRGQLNQAVNTVIEELGLPNLTESHPVIRASEACRAWAEAEALRIMQLK